MFSLHIIVFIILAKWAVLFLKGWHGRFHKTLTQIGQRFDRIHLHLEMGWRPLGGPLLESLEKAAEHLGRALT